MTWTHAVVREQPAQPHCGLQWTSMVKRAAFVLLASATSLHTLLSQVSCTLRSAPAILVWRNDLGDLTWTIWEAEMLVFVFRVRHRWAGLRRGHMPTFCFQLKCQDCSLLRNQKVWLRTSATWNPTIPGACVFSSRTTEKCAPEIHNFPVRGFEFLSAETKELDTILCFYFCILQCLFVARQHWLI